MNQIVLLVSLTAVFVGTLVAQDDGKVLENLRSFMKKAEQQAPEDNGIALVQDNAKEKQLKDLKSLLANAQNEDEDNLVDVQDDAPLGNKDSIQSDTQEEDDLDSLLAESQREDETLQKLMAAAEQEAPDNGNENIALEQDGKDFVLADEQEAAATNDEDEEVLAENFFDKQISAEEQDVPPSALAQDKENKKVTSQRYQYYARYYKRYYSRYYSRYYARYYIRHYSRYYSRYYNKYYRRIYYKNYSRKLSYYIRYYSRYYSRYYYRYYRSHYNRYYYNYYRNMYRRSCKRKSWWRRWGK